MRELNMQEVEEVSGGADSVGLAQGVLATGSALTGSLALVPGPHQIPAGAISGTLAATAGGLELLESGGYL